MGVDLGDPLSTNLYVGNLTLSTTEEDLIREFGRFGPLGSVKIMWPRTREQSDRPTHCGFIAFMKKADAVVARQALDGESFMFRDFFFVVHGQVRRFLFLFLLIGVGLQVRNCTGKS